jgi:hypothetical protein
MSSTPGEECRAVNMSYIIVRGSKHDPMKNENEARLVGTLLRGRIGPVMGNMYPVAGISPESLLNVAGISAEMASLSDD